MSFRIAGHDNLTALRSRTLLSWAVVPAGCKSRLGPRYKEIE